jgi:hypothetical protein
MNAWQILYLVGPSACMAVVLAFVRHLRERSHRRTHDWEMQHRLWRAMADQHARSLEHELRNSVGLKTASDGIKQMTRVGLGEAACSHWPRDPVVLSTGEQVAFICRRCGAGVVDETWVGNC